MVYLRAETGVLTDGIIEVVLLRAKHRECVSSNRRR